MYHAVQPYYEGVLTSLQIPDLWSLAGATIHAAVPDFAGQTKLCGHNRHLLSQLTGRYKRQALETPSNTSTPLHQESSVYLTNLSVQEIKLKCTTEVERSTPLK